MGCRIGSRRLEYFGWNIHSNFVVDMCFTSEIFVWAKVTVVCYLFGFSFLECLLRIPLGAKGA